jgi:hypothetical protein
MAQAVSGRPLTAEARVRARISPRGVYGGKNGIGTWFSANSSIFRCQYHSTATLHTHTSSEGQATRPMVTAVQRQYHRYEINNKSYVYFYAMQRG